MKEIIQFISACQPIEKYLAATGPAPNQPSDPPQHTSMGPGGSLSQWKIQLCPCSSDSLWWVVWEDSVIAVAVMYLTGRLCKFEIQEWTSKPMYTAGARRALGALPGPTGRLCLPAPQSPLARESPARAGRRVDHMPR